MTTAKEVLKRIKDEDVKYVDLRFTDPRGKWQHVTFDISQIEEETFAEGTFPGNSTTSLPATPAAPLWRCGAIQPVSPFSAIERLTFVPSTTMTAGTLPPTMPGPGTSFAPSSMA